MLPQSLALQAKRADKVGSHETAFRAGKPGAALQHGRGELGNRRHRRKASGRKPNILGIRSARCLSAHPAQCWRRRAWLPHAPKACSRLCNWRHGACSHPDRQERRRALWTGCGAQDRQLRNPRRRPQDRRCFLAALHHRAAGRWVRIFNPGGKHG